MLLKKYLSRGRTISRDGTKDRPIFIRAAQKWRAVLDAAVMIGVYQARTSKSYPEETAMRAAGRVVTDGNRSTSVCGRNIAPMYSLM